MMPSGTSRKPAAISKVKPRKMDRVNGYRLLKTTEASSVQMFSTEATKANSFPTATQNKSIRILPTGNEMDETAAASNRARSDPPAWRGAIGWKEGRTCWTWTRTGRTASWWTSSRTREGRDRPLWKPIRLRRSLLHWDPNGGPTETGRWGIRHRCRISGRNSNCKWKTIADVKRRTRALKRDKTPGQADLSGIRVHHLRTRKWASNQSWKTTLEIDLDKTLRGIGCHNAPDSARRNLSRISEIDREYQDKRVIKEKVITCRFDKTRRVAHLWWTGRPRPSHRPWWSSWWERWPTRVKGNDGDHPAEAGNTSASSTGSGHSWRAEHSDLSPQPPPFRSMPIESKDRPLQWPDDPPDPTQRVMNVTQCLSYVEIERSLRARASIIVMNFSCEPKKKQHIFYAWRKTVAFAKLRFTFLFVSCREFV